MADYIRKSVMTTVRQKWIDKGIKNPRESYFDFLDYKRIIEFNKDLTAIFRIPGDGLSWCDKLNVLTRDPACPEKPAPTESETSYFEKVADRILMKLKCSS